ncbi:hypothetical protein [Mycobacterium paragordonae]|jgi:hypothetical protein|uniref:hypothetical protein n=1 Tax=Mycobacterium paragordonae TaxID=1389713 RepID=UPI0012E323C3|nr:hypothetical protein [Mycobacterium paragordonae]
MAMNRVVERRLAYWPDLRTRAEAARLFADGMELRQVLARYPNEVPALFRGTRRGAARRAIWAHYALVQEFVGEPDTDPDDHAAVEQLVRLHGVEVARCRTGSSLSKHESCIPELRRFPPLAWYASQAPSSWPR